MVDVCDDDGAIPMKSFQNIDDEMKGGNRRIFVNGGDL